MKLLLICQDILSSNDASTNIIKNMVEFLSKDGHTVDIITQGDRKRVILNGSLNIYSVKKSFWEKTSKSLKEKHRFLFSVCLFIRKIVLFFLVRNYPNVEPTLSKRMYRLFRKNLSGNKYDYIIGFFRPFFTLDVCMRIKKHCRNSLFVPIVFDMIEPKDKPSFMPRFLFDRKIVNAFDNVFEYANNVFIPIYQKDEKTFYNIDYKKVKYYHFPTFDVDKNYCANVDSKELLFTDAEISFLYAGTLSRAFRNPTKLLFILNKLASLLPNKKIELYMFVSGDCNEIIDTFSREQNFCIHRCGFINKEELKLRIKSVDFLVNITNDYKTIVPSKVFEMLSTGKPLLNVISNGDDGSLKYIESYPLSINVESVEQVGLIYKVITDGLKNTASKEFLSRLYEECTIQYFIRQVFDIAKEE